MKDDKCKILFDASLLVYSLSSNTWRTGIYFVNYNLLRQILRNTKCDIAVYFHEKKEIEKYLSRYFPALAVPVITDLDEIRNYDVFLSATAPSTTWVKEYSPTISSYKILYDIIPILYPEFFAADLPQMRSMLGNFTAVDHYFSISENTKNDVLSRAVNARSDDITVIPLGTNEYFHLNVDVKAFEGIKKKYNIPAGKKYVLSLCTLEPRKNLVNAAKAFIKFIDDHGIDDLVFVLAGSTWDMFKQEWEKTVAESGALSEKIVSIGYVADEDVAVLYSNAMWFVYTSLYEGFGLPPLEAMKCGCPVVTSNNSSLPEVVGDAGIMVDSLSIDQHVKAYKDYYFNSTLREENSRKGLERAKLFTWEKCGETVCNTIIERTLRKRNKPVVTFIVPANHSTSTEDELMVSARIEMIAAQTYSNKEVLLLDCGLDGGVSDELAKNAHRHGAVYIRRPGPLYQACNAALDSIGGKYFSIVEEGVAYLTPDFTADSVAKCEENNAALSYTDFELSRRGNHQLVVAEAATAAFGDWFSSGMAFLNRTVVQERGGFAARYGAAAFTALVLTMMKHGDRLQHVAIRGVRLTDNNVKTICSEDFGRALYDVFGKSAGLTTNECQSLVAAGEGYSTQLLAKLFAKLPEQMGKGLCEKLIQKYGLNKIHDEDQRSDIARNQHLLFGFIPLTCKYGGSALRCVVRYCLGPIMLFKTVKRDQERTSYYLFGFLPIMRKKRRL